MWVYSAPLERRGLPNPVSVNTGGYEYMAYLVACPTGFDMSVILTYIEAIHSDVHRGAHENTNDAVSGQ